MIKENSDLKAEPFLLKPVGKNYLWGGNRLNDEFHKEIDLYPLAETWECSTHPDGVSIVASGKYNGVPLTAIFAAHPEYLGAHSQAKGELPILIKFIDAKSDLSVQVHPDNKYAQKYENGQLGKNEMWYVLDSKQSAKLVYGLNHSIDRKTFHQCIDDGTIEKYLQMVPVKKGDVFYIKAGTIHAIGAGVLIAEIQENSNLTYRMYDYNRLDSNGKRRALHIDKALDVANLNGSAVPKQPLRVLKYTRGCASEFLCRCQHFQVERALINTEYYREMVCIQSNELSFQVLLCIDGCGSVFYGYSESLCFFKGDCIFIPANSVPIKIHGCAQFLKICC